MRFRSLMILNARWGIFANRHGRPAPINLDLTSWPPFSYCYKYMFITINALVSIKVEGKLPGRTGLSRLLV